MNKLKAFFYARPFAVLRLSFKYALRIVKDEPAGLEGALDWYVERIAKVALNDDDSPVEIELKRQARKEWAERLARGAPEGSDKFLRYRDA